MITDLPFGYKNGKHTRLATKEMHRYLYGYVRQNSYGRIEYFEVPWDRLSNPLNELGILRYTIEGKEVEDYIYTCDIREKEQIDNIIISILDRIGGLSLMGSSLRQRTLGPFQ